MKHKRPTSSAGRRKSRRQRLAYAGLLRLGRGRVRKRLRKPPKGDMRGREVLAALLADRDEQR